MSFIDDIKNIPIIDYAEKCGFTVVKKGNRYCSLKEHDSVMIDITRNCFWRNSVYQRGIKGGSGSIIDFGIEMLGLEKNQVLRELAVIYDISSNSEKKDNTSTTFTVTKKIESKKENRRVGDIKLPKHTRSVSQVFRYLVNERKINSEVVKSFINKGLLYQSEQYNNCVFVSQSHRFACLRSTGYKRFAIDVEGCDYNECWYLKMNEKPTDLYVAESVIDIMSIITYLIKMNIDYSKSEFLALSGWGKLESMMYHIKKERSIENIFLGFDNDDAGQKAQTRAKEELNEVKFFGEIFDFNAPIGKDWNDFIRR